MREWSCGSPSVKASLAGSVIMSSLSVVVASSACACGRRVQEKRCAYGERRRGRKERERAGAQQRASTRSRINRTRRRWSPPSRISRLPMPAARPPLPTSPFAAHSECSLLGTSYLARSSTADSPTHRRPAARSPTDRTHTHLCGAFREGSV